MTVIASPFPQITSPPQSLAEVLVNEALAELSHMAVYGYAYQTSSGLTFGYYGGRWGGFAITAGTLTLATNDVNDIVVEIATGDISVWQGTDSPWNDPSFLRVYRFTTGATSITAGEDHRAGPDGVHGGGGTISSGGSVTHTGALTASAIMVGNGSDDSKVLASLGTTTTLLHGNAAGLPTFGAVSLTADVSGALPVANGGTASTSASAARTALGLAIGSDIQAFDADLSTIAGLTATTDSFMQAKSSAWAARTVAQVSADLQGTGLLTDAVGFRTIPQNSQSAAYTTVAADAGKHLLHPSADTTARIFTIDSNANVAYPVGTAITIVNQDSAGVITITVTSDTQRLAGTGSTGDRTLAANGIGTWLKVASTEWICSGTGLT